MSWSIELPELPGMPKFGLPVMLGGAASPPPPAPSALDPSECFPSLSYVQRISFFVGCLVGGVVFLALAVMNIPLVVLGRADKFALPFVLANGLLLASTVFLVGVQRQLTDMFASERLPYSMAYIGSMLLTFYLALWVQVWWLVLPSVVLQVCSMAMYGVSYIPMGTMMLSRAFGFVARVSASCTGCLCRRCFS